MHTTRLDATKRDEKQDGGRYFISFSTLYSPTREPSFPRPSKHRLVPSFLPSFGQAYGLHSKKKKANPCFYCHSLCKSKCQIIVIVPNTTWCACCTEHLLKNTRRVNATNRPSHHHFYSQLLLPDSIVLIVFLF